MIKLQNVGYAYGDKRLLSDVSLELSDGAFYFLTGPSGAGKTTLLKLCYLDLQPDLGSVELFNVNGAGLDRDGVALARQRLGIVHQNCQFVDHLSVAENIALPLTVTGRDSAARRNDINDLLDWTGLADRRQALPPELSGGERQRAALARALIGGPDIILADEPTGNIDWDMSVKLLSLLVELNRLGKSILIATHDLALIRYAKSQVTARVLRIRDGTVDVAGADL